MGHATSLSGWLRGCAAVAGLSLFALAAAPVRANFGVAVFAVGRASLVEHPGQLG